MLLQVILEGIGLGVLSCVHETISDLTRFPADKPCHAFQVSHVHIRTHSIQPCFQAGSRLIGKFAHIALSEGYIFQV